MPHVKLPAGEFYYRYDGPADAPLLVLSNSLGTDHSMWDPQTPVFTTYFRALRYDSRGHGASAAPPGPYTIADLGEDVLDLYQALGITRAHYWRFLSSRVIEAQYLELATAHMTNIETAEIYTRAVIGFLTDEGDAA